MGRKRNKKPKIKKEIPDKTVENRLKEVIEIRNKLLELGLTTNIEGIPEFNKKLNEWVHSGEYWEGRIPIKGAKKMAIMRLPNKQNHKIEVILRAWNF